MSGPQEMFWEKGTQEENGNSKTLEVNHTAGFEEQDVVLLADNRKRITVAACKL
jgi:hypothetical protein